MISVLNNLPLLFQVQRPDPNAVNNVADLLIKGGFIMIPILLLSVISIYFFVERYIYIRRNAVIDENLVTSIISELSSARTEKLGIKTSDNNTSLGRILGSGLSQQGKTAAEVEKYMESAANLEISEMEKNTGYLGIIAGIAPMLGFIGTISGVIKIFYNISLADNISIGIIAGGLYQKMICSGTGLIVGVIAYSCYHYLQMMIDRFSINMQREVNKIEKEL